MNYKRLRLSGTEVLNFISNLSTMYSAGIPILSAVAALSEEARGNTKKILDEINSDLLHGKHLYESLAKFPSVFDTITISMIKASEASGTLDVILKDLKVQIKKDMAFNRKVRTAITYPILVMVVFIAVMVLILVVVMPKIATVFTQLKIDLPLSTRILIFCSDLLRNHTIIVLTVIGTFLTGFFVLYRYKKRQVLNFFYKLPGISQLIRDIDLMRFTRSFHLLLNAGISINGALELAEQVVLKPEIAKAINHARQGVLSGKPLSVSFKTNRKLFHSTIIELTQAGEKTGSLDKSMEDIAEYLDYKISDRLSVLTALLEPIMLVVVAILVGSMMLSIIGPIYSLIGQIGTVH